MLSPHLARNNNSTLLTTDMKAPLLLPIFSLLPNARDHPLPTALFFAIIDLVNANALVTISDSNQAVSGRLYSALRKQIRWDGIEVAAWYERNENCPELIYLTYQVPVQSLYHRNVPWSIYKCVHHHRHSVRRVQCR